MNNNHLNNPNNNINNKEFNNNNNAFNHNNIGNNKKYQKQYNYNNSTYQQSNHINNNNNNNNMNNGNQNFNNNKNNKNNLNIDNNNYNLNNNNNLIKNYNQRSSKEANSLSNNSNKNNNINLSNNNLHQQKQYLLCLNIKLGNNQTETIKIKSLEECPRILKELKEIKKINEKAIKIIQNKIYETIEITKKIYNFGLNKYTYKNLAEINNIIVHNKNRNKNVQEIKKSNSSKHFNKILENEMMLSKSDVRKTESLNISF
jgi:hypothetical protein